LILIPLFRLNNLPRLLGGDFFTKRILRFAWHLTTIAWWGIAAALPAIVAPSPSNAANCLYIISLIFLVSGLMSAGFTKGVHISWIVFLRSHLFVLMQPSLANKLQLFGHKNGAVSPLSTF
jgi:hypothetical protein